jgi:hypothetical protein
MLQISKPLDAYMIINFRICENNQDAQKLTRTTILIKIHTYNSRILLAIYPEKNSRSAE